MEKEINYSLTGTPVVVGLTAQASILYLTGGWIAVLHGAIGIAVLVVSLSMLATDSDDGKKS